MSKYDYNEKLLSIKATLFDIYESQEKLIGLIEDENEKNVQISKYIRTKDAATKFIDELENLYGIKTENKLEYKDNFNSVNNALLNEETNPQIEETNNHQEELSNELDNQEETEEVNISIENQPSIEDNTEQTNTELENNEDLKIEETNPQIEDANNHQEESSNDSENQEEIKEEVNIDGENQPSIKDNTEQTNEDLKIEESEETSDNKFYQDNRNGTRPNFAYVPSSIYETIQKNSTLELSKNISGTDIVADSKLYKQDDNKTKGIIVRSDQLMKLSLSRNRQEGVLNEAKLYRKKQAEYSQKQLLIEEEKQMNEKVKSLELK